MRNVVPAIEKFHSSILVCIGDAATRAVQVLKMEEVALARWTSIMERKDIKLDLIKTKSDRHMFLSLKFVVDVCGKWLGTGTLYLGVTRGHPSYGQASDAV
jgi:hypothetical protein